MSVRFSPSTFLPSLPRAWWCGFVRRAGLSAALAATALIAACGGGGGGSTERRSAGIEPGAAGASAAYAGVCTAEGEASYARAYLDEAYLWWDRVVPVPATGYADLRSYFKALLVTTPDASGRPTDRFSTVLEQSDADALLNQAAADPQQTVVLSSGAGTVPLVTTMAADNGRRVGYVLFNKHAKGSQDALITAFSGLQRAGVDELVLDIRNNPGGYLYVAQALASMVAGPQHAGKVFEEARYNSKRQSENARNTLRFLDAVGDQVESVYPRGTPLPQLSLPRVYLLASGRTCSASESIVNGLRGIGVDVVLVGDTTCGKPYGFHRHDNCGKSYFAIEFQGYNAQGWGDYNGGFAPTCPVAEDPTAALGSRREPLLAAALQHIATGACPAATARPRMTRVVDPAEAVLGRLLVQP